MLEAWRPRVPASLLLLVVAAAVVLVVLPLPAGGQACPRSCNCYQASEVHCTFRSLLNIPPGLPAHTRRINLGFNSISRIQDGSLVNLKKLELLMLHSNDLRLLQDGLFRDLKSLQILKLSYNKLREISSPQTFSGLSSLLRLYLDHNLLEHLHPRALLQLPGLRLLRLQGNRLHRLHPHALCTLSLLNTYYFSTLRHLDLSNNSLTRLPRASLQTAPLLETLVLQANPWSCDCRMGWLLAWNRAHPDLLKCPSGPQCPLCSSPSDLQGRGLFEQSDLPCSPPIIPSPGRDAPPEEEVGEIQARESLGEPLGSASLGLSDQQGNSIDLSCNITHTSDSREVSPPPDLSLLSSAPIALALSLSLECPVEREGYESLWRILAYYSETALHLEREIMLSKAPALAYRYRQTAETEGYYNTGVKVSIKARPHWLLQPALGIQLNRAQSTASRVSLIVSTLVSAHPDPHTSHPSFAASHPWVLISANASALAAVAGSKVELPCPLLSSGNAKVHWVLPDGSKLISSSSGPNLRVSASGLLLQKAELANAGVYYCVAQAGRDVDVLPVRLAVEESSAPHSGEEVGPPFKATAGQPVTLSCKASGSPTPELSWLLPDGNIVRRGVAVSGGVVMQSNGSLSLPSTSLRDAGHYRCMALNQHGGDSLSTQLEITPRHPPTLRTSFRRGPQSASGRSTKIRAPLLRQVEEGSGAGEEEDERTFVVNRRRQRPLQPPPNRRFPAGKPMRRGQGREGPLRRGGGGGGRPLAAPDQRRNRFDSRHRVTNNKQRIDPKKWADLLAKIRQKTSPTESSRPDTAGETGESTAEPTRGGQDKDAARREGEDAAERAETEGSSVDDASLQEEGLHPVYPTATQTQTPEAQPGTDRENQFHSHSQSETIESVTQRETVTSKPVSNEIISEAVEAEERETKPTSSRPRPQRPRQGFYPNLVPESRPQSPWNSRRRMGQGRRIINRQRGRVLTPARPLPDPTNRQSVTPDTSSDQTTTAATAAELSTESRRVDSPASTASPPSPSVASGSQVPRSQPPTPTPSPHASSPPPDTVTHVDLTTHSANIPGSAVSRAPATARPGISTAQTSAGGTTGTRAAPGKHAHGPTSKHGEEPERGRNVPDARHTTPSPSPPSDTQPSGGSSITSAAPETNGFSTSAEVAPSASATALTDDTLLTTTESTPLTTNAITSTTEKTTTAPASTTTTTTTTVFTSTAPPTPTTSTSTTATTTPSATALTSTTTFIPTTSSPTTTTETTSTPMTSTPTTALQTSPAPTTAVTSTSTRAPSAERPSVGHAEPRGRPVSGSPDQSRPPTDWKNPGANSIPDSHGSRPQRPPSPPLPAAPGAPVVRSRPRIADPHIRSASFPAESVARLTCEAQGEPKPSITWTKVATGAVMSIHSRAQRFEVLPNGTLVIQNVQLQDRGTYICSAQSFMGRDRLLTTLEVWTRPPRMTLASYREASIHQGGELHLECQASGVPAPLLSWVLPDRSVLTSPATATPSATAAAASRVTMSANGTLHILATSAGDRGVYRCVASNSAGAASASVRVHVSSLPPALQQPKEEHLLLSPGRPVYAHCSARGAPPPTLRWRIPDGTLVRPSQFLHGNLFVLPNGTLHIRKVGPKDSGNYECVASNAVGADKRTVRVRVDGSGEAGAAAEEKVSEKPSSSSSLQKDKNKPGDPSQPLASARPPLPSPSDGAGASLRPPPSAPSQPGRPNSANSPPPIDKTDAASPQRPDTIRVPPLPPPPPSNAPTNLSPARPGPLGETTADSLSPPDKGGAVPPSPVSPFTKAHIVSTSPSISTVSYGGDLQLHCSVTGNPPPIIIWRTPNRKLVDMHFSFDRRLSVRPNGTLTVGAVTEKDVGDYLCIARNKVADDYRLLRVSVVTKPAKIQHKQPPDQMVSLGKPLKVDCLASGLPDPAVRWSLPDGTMVNSVLQGEERGGRTRRLTVFDNGTLLVPAVGMKEQGEYTCYAENQGGQDMMKVNVKIMTTSPPTFTDDRSYRVVKVRQGETAAIPCQARGDPIPAVMWFSPAHRVIPRSSGSGLYSERVVVVPGGSLEVRQAQRIDTGNYTCRAVNSAGQRSMVVGLQVEGPGQSGPTGGGGWSAATNGFNGRNGVGGGGDGWTRNAVPGNGGNAAGGAASPALRSETPNGFSRSDAGIATQSGSVISVGVDGGRNVGFKVDNSGINRNTPGVPSGSRRLSTSHSAGSAARSSNNEVTAGKPHNDSSAGGENGKISGAAGDVFRGGAPNNWVNAGASRAAVANAGGRPSSSTVMLTTVKQQAAKGQSVLLPCPSHGSPPPRLAWLLPGNGVLPAPYYGSRITVHRNGSLELRGVRPGDSGTLVCVVRGERGETRIQVELQVSDAAREEAGPPAEPPKSPVSPVSSQSRSVETTQQRAPVTQGPPHRGPSAPRLTSTGPGKEPTVSTHTAALVSIINGETLRLHCPKTPAHPQGPLSWTLPSGKVVPRGESGDSGRYFVQPDGTLVVQRASVFDRGTYSCRSAAYDSSAVSVAMVPVIVIAYPPRITKGPSPVTYTRPGVAVELPCLTIATPRATVTWETPDLTQLKVMGQARIYGNRYLSPQGSLVIQNPTIRDTGFYRCTANNVIGADTKATYLHVI